jgi:hypothetical protein
MDVPSSIFLISSEQISNAIRAKLISSGILGNDAYVVVAGPANTYAHYVTTIEEYSQQRYEGASTIFGQCELSILPDQFFLVRTVDWLQIPWMRISINTVVWFRTSPTTPLALQL